MPDCIDWDKVRPEEVTGYVQPHKVNWDAVKLVIERSDGSRLGKDRLWKSTKKLIERRGIHVMLPSWRMSYCAARLELGDYSDYWGWEFRGVRNDDESKNWAADIYYQRTWLPQWGGQSVGRLLVLGEQGVGDALFFGSIIPECIIRCGEVVYECDSRLHSMLQRTFKTRFQCREERPFEDRRLDYPCDAFIPAAELMRMFRRDKRHFPAVPYIKPDPLRVAEFEKYRGRTGVSWVGRQGRIDPLLLGITDAVSLQYNEENKEIEAPEIDLRNDLEGVLALVSVLARVVTVPTTVHHISGAAGVKTQIIVPPYGSCKEEDTNQIHWDYPVGKLPWYSDATVFKDVHEWKSRTT